jgi:hypothetical protein
MQATTPHLSSGAAYAFLDALLDNIKGAIIAYAAEVDYPVEAVLEMAILGLHHPDSISFVDCNPLVVVNDLKKAS